MKTFVLITSTLLALIAPSEFYNSLGYGYAPLFVLYASLFYYYFVVRHGRVNIHLLLLYLAFLVCGFIISLMSGDINAIYFTLNTVMSIALVIVIFNQNLIIDYINYITNTLLVFLIDAIMYRLTNYSLFYYLLGHFESYNFLIENSTMSVQNLLSGDYYRIRSIYDEPGSFSFFICSAAALRHVCGLDKVKTWSLLVGGLMTLSFAHFLYFIFHFIADLNFKYFYKMIKKINLNFL